MAEENETQEDQEPGDGGAAKPKGKKTILMVGGAVPIIIGIAALITSMAFPSDPKDDEEEVPEKGPTISFPLESIMVNLDEERLERILNIEAVLEFSGYKSEGDVETLVTDCLPEIKNGLIGLLSGKSVDDIRGGEKAKALILDEMRVLLQAIIFSEAKEKKRAPDGEELPPRALESIYFITYLVQ